jgi:hypothetical protein
MHLRRVVGRRKALSMAMAELKPSHFTAARGSRGAPASRLQPEPAGSCLLLFSVVPLFREPQRDNTQRQSLVRTYPHSASTSTPSKFEGVVVAMKSMLLCSRRCVFVR